MASAASEPGRSCFSLTTFDHENTFLKLVATAEMVMDLTTEIIAAVLLSVSQPTFPHRWVEVGLNAAEIERLGLHAESVEVSQFVDPDPVVEIPAVPVKNPFSFQDGAEQFHEFLMQAPTPFVMTEGPEHRMTFINPPYVRLLGRLTKEAFLGKTVREALPEMEGQPFFGLMDEVYRTGVPYIGIEVPGRLQSDISQQEQDLFFDFIYHPLRDRAGRVSGVMIQATDVTDRVLSHQVMSSREDQLYTQWQELEAIYRSGLVGVMLLEANKELRILRINEIQAGLLGEPVDEVEGRPVRECCASVPALEALVERGLAGETVLNEVVRPMGGGGRDWLVSVTPLRSKTGVIEKLYCLSVEVPGPAGMVQ
ncbi:PAS domain-containing protein [Granulicella tundricola]|nr:PAS domain-containing protein [Granulicella tundricola]